ncbi:MAG: acyl-CoA dehydrogenase C-terminal domain-containing protein, partial [Methylocystaceae bacterium]
WEGTNYIQSLDLVGRKFTMGKGKPFMNWLGEIASFIETNQEFEELASEFKVYKECWQAYQGILGLLQKYLGDGKITLLPLYSTRILHATSMIYCGMISLDQAMVAAKKLQEVGDSHHDANFYKGKIASARYYVLNEVPNILSIKRMFEIADTSPVDVPEDALG